MMASKTPTTPNSPKPPSFRGSSPVTTPSNGLARTHSIRGTSGLSRSKRTAVSRASPNTRFSTMNSNVPDEGTDEDVKAETIQLIDELRSKLRKAEITCEEHQRQMTVLQKRLDDSLAQEGILEDRVQEEIAKIKQFENDQTVLLRQTRDLENSLDVERKAAIKEKDDQHIREQELQAVIHRLKENLAQRDMRSPMIGEAGSPRSR